MLSVHINIINDIFIHIQKTEGNIYPKKEMCTRIVNVNPQIIQKIKRNMNTHVLSNPMLLISMDILSLI